MSKAKEIIKNLSEQEEEKEVTLFVKTKGNIEQLGGSRYNPVTIEKVGDKYIVRRYEAKGVDLSKPISDWETAFEVYLAVFRRRK